MSERAWYFQVVLPWPHPDLNPNARGHWSRRAGQVAQHRALAAMTARCQPMPDMGAGPYEVSLIFHPPDRRWRDLDNMRSMCKAYQDGVCDALGINDHAINCDGARRGAVHKAGSVIVTIMPSEYED